MENDDNNGYRAELYTPEAKRARFKRVVERRTTRILDDIRLLGNTSNKTLYYYDEHDIEKVFSAIDDRLKEVKGKFRVTKKDKPFTLD